MLLQESLTSAPGSGCRLRSWRTAPIGLGCAPATRFLSWLKVRQTCLLPYPTRCAGGTCNEQDIPVLRQMAAKAFAQSRFRAPPVCT